jgi:ABC-type sugar transport system permease subunit
MKGAVLQWYSTFFERRNHRMSTKGKKGWIIAFVLPCVVLFCLVYAIPFIMVITTSFCNYTLTQAPAFQGLENFKIIFADYDFVVSIVNTLKWVLILLKYHWSVQTDFFSKFHPFSFHLPPYYASCNSFF